MADNPKLDGKYELLAARWRHYTSEAGAKVQEWTDHFRGDIVDLEHSQALRLLKAGAVAPTKATEKAAQSVRPEAKATDKNQAPPTAQVGSGPAEPVVVAQPSTTPPPAGTVGGGASPEPPQT